MDDILIDKVAVQPQQNAPDQRQTCLRIIKMHNSLSLRYTDAHWWRWLVCISLHFQIRPPTHMRNEFGGSSASLLSFAPPTQRMLYIQMQSSQSKFHKFYLQPKCIHLPFRLQVSNKNKFVYVLKVEAGASER